MQRSQVSRSTLSACEWSPNTCRTQTSRRYANYRVRASHTALNHSDSNINKPSVQNRKLTKVDGYTAVTVTVRNRRLAVSKPGLSGLRAAHNATHPCEKNQRGLLLGLQPYQCSEVIEMIKLDRAIAARVCASIARGQSRVSKR
jgi:hypothetical protein